MIIMDTHIWLWWVNEEIDFLGQVRNDLIQNEEMVAVSAISCFEVAWLDAHNRIELPSDDDIEDVAYHFQVSPRLVHATLVNHHVLSRETMEEYF
jgi:PIN domain nuclease of toxin-antitoxin system